MSNGKRAREIELAVKQAIRDADSSNGEVSVSECVEYQIGKLINTACREALDEAIKKESFVACRCKSRILKIRERYADGKEVK